jgi:hypothetical protein
MTRARSLLLIGSLAAFAACEPPTAVDADADVRAGTAPRPAGIISASAMGAGHRDSRGLPIVHNFHARLLEDGSSDGQYYYREVASGVWIRVQVTCMSTANGDQAWIAGIITGSSIPALVGTVSYFFTFDNGEGTGTPDVISRPRAGDIAGEDTRFCEEQPVLLGSSDVLHGNVQVSG